MLEPADHLNSQDSRLRYLCRKGKIPMPAAHLQIKPLRSEEIVFQSMPPDLILLNLETGYYYSTNTLGAEVWQRCDGSTNVQQIIDELNQQFEVGLDQLTDDVVAFINQLINEQLLRSGSDA